MTGAQSRRVQFLMSKSMLIQLRNLSSSIITRGKDFIADEEASAIEYAALLTISAFVAYPVGVEVKNIVVGFFDNISNSLSNIAR